MPKNGFTLVEILVVMGVMAIIGVVVFANFRNGKEEQLLQKALSETQSVLKLAQSNASASVVCGNLGGGSYWQVQINPSLEKIILGCSKGEGEVQTQRVYDLEKGVNISFICPSSGSGFNSTVTIVYAAFSGLPKFINVDSCGVNFSGLGVKFQSEKDNTISKQFIISSGGAINAK